jgi:hypothetical protein
LNEGILAAEDGLAETANAGRSAWCAAAKAAHTMDMNENRLNPFIGKR